LQAKQITIQFGYIICVSVVLIVSVVSVVFMPGNIFDNSNPEYSGFDLKLSIVFMPGNIFKQ